MGLLLLILGIVLGFAVSKWCFFILVLPLLGTAIDQWHLDDYLYNPRQRAIRRTLRDAGVYRR